MDGKWQVILQTKKKTIKGFGNEPSRQATVSTLLVNDRFQFIVNDYEVVEETQSDKSGTLEIDGKIYIPMNNAKYCSDSLVTAIKVYLTEWHVLNPSKDITSLKEATDYMTQINKMAKELYDLKK
jgi:hypothetical protein